MSAEKKGRTFCLQCGKKIAGRTDKVFCSDRCRSLYNYYKRRARSMVRTRVLGTLDRNYTILDGLIGDGVNETELADLELMGFVPGCVTSVSIRGKRFDLWCYEIRYSISNGRLFNIRRPHDLLKMMP